MIILTLISQAMQTTICPIAVLGACTNNLFKWFHENHMEANADKCHLLVTTNGAVSANMGEFV